MREQVLRRILRLVTMPEEELEQVEQAEEIELPHGTLIIKPTRRAPVNRCITFVYCRWVTHIDES